MKIINREYIEKQIYRLKRPVDSYKNNYGKVMVMAGSEGMAGAAVLCGRAALRTGSGLVKYCAPEIIRTVLQIAVPEATWLPRISDTVKGDYDAIAVGPGLGDHNEDKPLLQKIFSEFRGTVVLDADGLNDIIRFGLENELKEAVCDVIITPHEGEAARLLRVSALINREKTALDLSNIYNVTAVLKGHETLVAVQGEEMACNVETGNPGMATGGSGDVLTGIIASLAGQGFNPADAAKTGVYLHGMAGDICAKNKGQSGMIAGDICEAIPDAINSIL